MKQFILTANDDATLSKLIKAFLEGEGYSFEQTPKALI